MDGDASVEPTLDAFSLTLPLPYRVALITVLATWGWGANLHYLYLQKIDVPSLIRYPGRPSAAHLPHHHSAYRLATVTSSVLAASLLIFWAYTRHDVDRVLYLDWLPMTTLSVLGLLLILPFPLNLIKRHSRRRLSGPTAANGSANNHGSPPPWALPQDGRRRFAATLRRVAVGGLAEAQHGKFGDILLADVLTSYSKVLGDLYVVICMFFFTSSRAGASTEPSATDQPDRNCGGGVIVPLIMAMPFLARFRQCLIEYLRVRNATRDRPFDPAVGWGGQHLANAAKYATSFPVILFSALQRNAKAAEDAGTTTTAVSTTYYRLWVLAVAVNSLYSFYWDVAKDWDLTLFDGARARNAPDHPWALRRRLLINRGQPLTYYAAIVLDLVLRCTWSLKLSPHLDHVADFESSLFLMQLLEVLRRWVWIFFRVETEWIRSTNSNTMPDFSQGLLGGGFGSGSSGSRAGSASSSTSGGDIMLGDYTPKYDDGTDDDDI